MSLYPRLKDYYNAASKQLDVVLEGAEKNLEMRITGHFFNLETQTYDSKVREKFLELIREVREKRLNPYTIAFYTLFHPIKIHKIKKLKKEGKYLRPKHNTSSLDILFS